MTTLLRTALGLSIVMAVTLPAGAEAQTRRKVTVAARTTAAPPLTVNRRSWLDPGTAAPVGTTDAYLSQSTTLNRPVYASFLRDRFGQSTLPGQFDLPFQDNPRGPESGGIFFDQF